VAPGRGTRIRLSDGPAGCRTPEPGIAAGKIGRHRGLQGVLDTLRQALGDAAGVDLHVVLGRADAGKVAVEDAVDHHLIALLPGIEAVEDEPLRGLQPRGS
jgi:hypothetical protein